MPMHAATDEGGAPRGRGGLVVRLLLAAIIGGAFFAAWRFGLFDYLNLETLRAQRQNLAAFVSANTVLAYAIFIGVYVLATTFAVPGALWITITGGFLFGLVGGALATTLGATIGATLLFLAARYLLADALRARAGPFMRRFEEGFRKDAASYLLSMRLIPAVPFFVANIAPAFVGVSLPVFVATTAIGIIPGVLAYTWIGAGLGAAFDAGQTPDIAVFARQLTPAFIALGLVALAPALYRLVFKRRKAEHTS